MLLQNATVQGISGTGSLRIGAAFFVSQPNVIHLNQMFFYVWWFDINYFHTLFLYRYLIPCTSSFY